MDLTSCVIQVLDEEVSLNGRSSSFTRETLLLGAVPEFGSMAVVSPIATLEEPLSIVIGDGELATLSSR